MPRSTNLRNWRAYQHSPSQAGYQRAFSESWIAKQDPAAQKRMRRHNDRVAIARAVSKAKRAKAKKEKERAKLQKDEEHCST